MNSLALNRRISILSPAPDTTENGFPTMKWPLLADVWANRRELTGREYYAAKAVQAENHVIYTIRYRTGITNEMRILDGAKLYDIKACPDLDGRKRWLELHTVEVKPSVSGT